MVLSPYYVRRDDKSRSYLAIFDNEGFRHVIYSNSIPSLVGKIMIRGKEGSLYLSRGFVTGPPESDEEKRKETGLLSPEEHREFWIFYFSNFFTL